MSKDKLIHSGPFSLSRDPYIQKIFLCYQAKENIQVTVAKDLLRTPHGQICKPIPQSYVNSTSTPIICLTEQNLLNPKCEEVQTSTFCNPKLEELFPKLIPFVAKYGLVIGDEKRQRNFIDLGTNGGQSHSTCTELGVSIPSPYTHTFMKGTNIPNPFVKMLFETFLEQIKKYCPFISWKDMSEQRLNTFARRISPVNIIEAMRVSVTPFGDTKEKVEKNICNIHIDEKNDKNFSEVVIFSHVVYNADKKLDGG